MDPRENFGPRLGFGVLIGLGWSLVPAIFLYDHLLACFIAGMTTGIVLTWVFTRTSLEHPVIFGTVSLPISTWLYFTLFSVARVTLATAGNQPTYGSQDWFGESTMMTIVVLLSPFIIFPWLTSVSSTCLLTAVFQKRPPRRRDLLPERWDG